MIDWDNDVLAPMMDASLFGENVQPTYMPATGGAFQIDGVFDDAFTSVDILDDGAPGFSTANPVLGVRAAQFPPGSPPVGGDRVRVDSVATTFFVNQVKPDGHGWIKLELTVAA